MHERHTRLDHGTGQPVRLVLHGDDQLAHSLLHQIDGNGRWPQMCKVAVPSTCRL